MRRTGARMPFTVGASATDVQRDGPVDAVAVPRLLSKERRRVVLRLHGDEPIVAAESPPAAVPLHAAADVAGEERLRVVDPELRLLEHRQSADAAGDVRDDGAVIGRVHDDVAAVVEKMRGGPIDVVDPGEVEALRYADRAAEFSFDADVPVEVVRDRATEVVVAERRFLRVLVLR